MRSPRKRAAGPRLLAGLCAAVVASIASSAGAYPTATIFAPNGESLPFLGFTVGGFGAFALSPKPALSSVWGGVDVGVLPSVDFTKTAAGPISFAGAELGFDVLGPNAQGNAVVVFNGKLQIIAEGPYWPTLAVGLFELSPDPKQAPALGYIVASKSFSYHGAGLGQLSFGLMRSFSDTLAAPRCLDPTAGTTTCVFRGSEPFLDRNGGLLAAYLSPWIGPVAFAVDYVGGTSAVSSTNVAAFFRLWNGGSRGYLSASLVGYLANDRRPSPPGPGAEDGVLVGLSFSSSITELAGWDPVKEWSTKKRLPHEDPFEAPPLTPPPATAAPDPAEKKPPTQ